MSSQFPYAITAIVLALMPLPSLWAIDYANSDCGDGLCGTFSGMLVLVLLALSTLFFMVRSARRNESPAILRLVPVALWLLALLPLVF